MLDYFTLDLYTMEFLINYCWYLSSDRVCIWNTLSKEIYVLLFLFFFKKKNEILVFSCFVILFCTEIFVTAASGSLAEAVWLACSKILIALIRPTLGCWVHNLIGVWIYVSVSPSLFVWVVHGFLALQRLLPKSNQESSVEIRISFTSSLQAESWMLPLAAAVSI